MTDKQKEQIANLRHAGYSYSVIADKLGLSVNTIKTHCKRHGLSSKEIDKSKLVVRAANLHYCQECGEVVIQPPRRKFKKFCSDKCRMKWWNTHQYLIKKEANYNIVCRNCGKQFVSYGNKENIVVMRVTYKIGLKINGPVGELRVVCLPVFNFNTTLIQHLYCKMCIKVIL